MQQGNFAAPSVFSPIESTFDAMMLSRAASHIASTLSLETSRDAMRQVLAEVTRRYGADGVTPFLISIRSWLLERGFERAFMLVQHQIEHGAFPTSEPALTKKKLSLAVAAQKDMRNRKFI